MVRLRPRAPAQTVEKRESRPMKLRIRSRRVLESEDEVDLSEAERTIKQRRVKRRHRSRGLDDDELLERELRDLAASEEENDEEEANGNVAGDYSDNEDEDIPIDALPRDDEHGVKVDDLETSEINQLVAFLVSFRARFDAVFDGVPNITPAELEQGVKETELTGVAELFLCKLLTLALNRKKPVEPGRWARALEDIKSQTAVLGYGESLPSIDYRSETAIQDLSPVERLQFFQWLVFYALNSNEVVRDMVTAGHTRNLRKNPDTSGIPLSPLGKDSMGTYWMVEANGETGFCLYRTNVDSDHVPVSETAEFRKMTAREKRLALKLDTPVRYILRWTAVASNVDELEAFVTRHSEILPHRLREKLAASVAVYREAEERAFKAQRRERRRKQLFDEAELVRQGEGRYSGRTRGKRINYNEEHIIEESPPPTRASRRIRAAQEKENEAYAYASDPEETPGTRKSKRLRGAPVEYTGVWDDRGQLQVMVTLRYRKKDPKQEEEEEKIAHGNLVEERRASAHHAIEMDLPKFENTDELEPPSEPHAVESVHQPLSAPPLQQYPLGEQHVVPVTQSQQVAQPEQPVESQYRPQPQQLQMQPHQFPQPIPQLHHQFQQPPHFQQPAQIGQSSQFQPTHLHQLPPIQHAPLVQGSSFNQPMVSASAVPPVVAPIVQQSPDAVVHSQAEELQTRKLSVQDLLSPVTSKTQLPSSTATDSKPAPVNEVNNQHAG